LIEEELFSLGLKNLSREHNFHKM